MATRNDITSTIFTACQAVIPDIKWSYVFTGANKSKDVEGTVSCDKITFKELAKGETYATANYTIFIIDMGKGYDVDSAADALFKVFNQSNMGNICYNVDIKSITYGSVIGVPASSLCKLEMTVEYPFEVRKE